MFYFRVLTVAVLTVSGWAARPSERETLRTEIRTALHLPDPLPSLRDKNYGQFPLTTDVVADRVSYATSYDLRVPALVYHAPGATVVQHPALIVVNGRGEDKAARNAYLAGILYARAGAVVLTYDPIGQYERNSERRSAALPALSGEAATRLTGSMVTDVMQAAQYLANRKDVDPKRIAVLGFASLACAVDLNIHACVLAADDFSGIEKLQEDTGKLLGSSKDVFQSGQPLSGSVAVWLNDKLKFPNWTKKQVAALPETNWGEDIPAVPRENLQAVPEVVWAAEKQSYIYETWLERATVADAGPRELKSR